MTKEDITDGKAPIDADDRTCSAGPTAPRSDRRATFALIAGCLYIAFGLLQLVVSTGIADALERWLLIPADPLGSFILFVLGAVFLSGHRELSSGIEEGAAFVYVGIGLCLMFSAIYLLMMVSNALEVHVVLNEDYAGWSPLDDVRPGLYLGIVALIGYFSWRERFSLAAITGIQKGSGRSRGRKRKEGAL